MTLADTLQKYFSTDVRERGYEIYLAGNRITYFNAGPNFVEATVADSEDYDVEIEWFGGDLELSCSCPYSEEHGACEHLWAVIIAANTSKIITEQRLRHRMRVRFGAFDDDNFDDDIGFDFDLAPLPAPPPKALPKAPPKPPDWRQKLSALEQRMRVAAREPWPAGREIRYVVDAVASHSASACCFTSGCATARRGERDGIRSRSSSVPGARCLRFRIRSTATSYRCFRSTCRLIRRFTRRIMSRRSDLPANCSTRLAFAWCNWHAPPAAVI